MYHLHVRFVQRSQGRSSVAAAAYRAGEKMRDEHTGKLYDFTHKTHVEHSEILLPEHVPVELADRATLWNRVEQQLNHKRGQPAFEVEVALPRELSPEKRLELARTFAEEQLVSKGLIVDLCIHMGVASDGGEHPHCHMLCTTRRWSDDGNMGKAARDLQDSPALLKKVYALEQEGDIENALLAAKGTNLAGWRKAWADYSNDFLAEDGHADRVDHRTLAAQQIDREAMPHMSFGFYRELEGLRGWIADRVEAFKEVSWRNEMREQFDRIRETRRDLTAEFIAHAREYAPKLFPELGHDGPDKGLGHER